MSTQLLTAVIHKEDKWYVAECPEVGTVSQGQSIEEKLEPSLDGLGINKNTQQEADMVLGLFAPHRYNLARHRGYDIKRMGNKYRSCRILKDRNNGLDGKYIPLYFNGATNTFKELDKATEIDYDLIT